MSFDYIDIYTDGSCDPNPGPGGWAAFLMFKKDGKIVREKMLSGGRADTTNNVMEIQASIEALKYVGPVKARISVTTDSDYLKKGITQWIKGWKKNGWRTAKGTPVKNKDLWVILDGLTEIVSIQWNWVKAHNGHIHNEAVDAEAKKQMRLFRDGPKKKEPQKKRSTPETTDPWKEFEEAKKLKS